MSGAPYLEGHVTTPHGIVVVWSDRKHANLRFVWRGREHSLLRTPLTARGLATAAGRFARQIAEGEP